MITQEQWDEIDNLVDQIQRIDEDVDTSSVVMWLTQNLPESE